MSSWAILRQVVIGTTTHEQDTAAVRAAFGLGTGFDDPELKEMNLVDATMPIAPGRYLEFVAPVTPEGPVASWLAKVGGRGGFVLSVQHPDAAAVRTRAAELGVRVPIDMLAFGRIVLQLHPKDVGLVLEVDGIDDPAVWFWDSIDPGPDPSAYVDDIVGVEVPVADPAATAAQWRRLLDLPEPAEPTVLDLGGPTVRFVDGGPSSNWTVLLRRASASATDPGLPGITFRLV
ncbi:MAG TPA: hypothetical protein VMU51_23755 [Mycobacteriales bacterium]|nr:hypothetical protein [Mycobacteriales bacterium]